MPLTPMIGLPEDFEGAEDTAVSVAVRIRPLTQRYTNKVKF